MQITIPLALPSVSNIREHWAKTMKRKQLQKNAVKTYLQAYQSKITLPCYITLTRGSSRFLDDDNLSTAFKSIRDQVASFLIPDLKMGQADNDPRLHWIYSQEKTSRKNFFIKIKIENIYDKSLERRTKN